MRVGASWGGFDTTIVFTGDRRAAFRQHAVAASFEIRPSERLGIQVAAGGILGGTIDLEGTRHEVQPGVLGSVAASYRILDGQGALPLVLATLSLAHSRARTERVETRESAGLRASDLRLGLILGKTVADVLTPYAVVRAFGGPVSFRLAGASIVGSDRYHYQAGAGLVVATRSGFDLSLEAAVVGERRITAGAGYAF